MNASSIVAAQVNQNETLLGPNGYVTDPHFCTTVHG